MTHHSFAHTSSNRSSCSILFKPADFLTTTEPLSYRSNIFYSLLQNYFFLSMFRFLHASSKVARPLPAFPQFSSFIILSFRPMSFPGGPFGLPLHLLCLAVQDPRWDPSQASFSPKVLNFVLDAHFVSPPPTGATDPGRVGDGRNPPPPPFPPEGL